MSQFERLHPSLQHHIVNSLGWAQLRPTQLSAIDPILDGKHALLLAPTAGGKTEAATFPVLSRMLSEGWDGLSVLYVCPLRALLNNLELRLRNYTSLVGRSAALWHGDIHQASRHRLLREPPDILLTTPESLEAMLISRRVDHRVLFCGLRAVIVDELHAFAGDDRGWHLLAVIERLERIAARKIQRIGLSATVGNPNDLLSWLSRGEDGVVVGQSSPPAGGEVTLDYVGSIDNAAQVLARLYRGEKRLVFCDSRSKVERLAAALRGRGVRTFISHSSLGIDERRQSEEAFATGEDCVIVATSTLELGIDVGDLDRVIQIDAPATVSSFLQRMGRSGRRQNSQRNCLFLATGESAFLQAAAIVNLWRHGWVEPVLPPPDPLHLFAQQVLALVLQENGLPRQDHTDWVGRVFGHEDRRFNSVIDYMIDRKILACDGEILGMGQQGEETLGRRNFMELVTAFTTPLLLSVRHQSVEIGQVHPSSLGPDKLGSSVLLLAGRNWQVIDVDWKRRVVAVEPSGQPGQSRWMGSARTLSYPLCQSIKDVITTGAVPAKLSRRAENCLNSLKEQFEFIDGNCVTVVMGANERARWWTFAGARANAMLSSCLRKSGVACRGHDDLAIDSGEVNGDVATKALANAKTMEWQGLLGHALSELKFSECLPPSLAAEVLASRFIDTEGFFATLDRPLCFIAGQE